MPSAIMEQHTLESLLTNKDLRMDFIFYVNKIHAQESLLFWMEVEMFKLIVESDECLKQAKLLYYRYIHPNAKSPINVGAKQRNELEAIMGTGIWDQTLFNPIQANVHECLKFGVVRDFSALIAKRKIGMEHGSSTPAHAMVERYEGALHRHDKKSNTFGFSWIKKHIILDTGTLTKKDRMSFLGKHSKIGKTKPSDSVVVDDPSVGGDVALQPVKGKEVVMEAHRERLNQQRLQQHIQLLRTLHQQQEVPDESEHFNTVEFSSTNPPLSKSISMPSILSRGISVVNLKPKS